MKIFKRHRGRLPRFLVLVLWLALLNGCRLFSPGDLGRGSLPNLSLSTLGGWQLWADVAWSDGWRVQRQVWSRHYRLLDPQDTRRAWGSESYCVSHLPSGEQEELVILLHGLARTRFSLDVLKRHLEARGHHVASLSYPSTRGTLEQHAQAVEQVLNRLPNLRRVSFVTHSLGGRVVLRLLQREGEWMERVELKAVLQLAPPNRGSQFAARTGKIPFVGALLGPSFWEVAESSDELPPAACKFGVIAGVRGTRWGWNPLLAEDDDGVVGLGETRPDFPHEHRPVTCLHTFLMTDEEVLDATGQFLAQGHFGPESERASRANASAPTRAGPPLLPTGG